MLGRRGRAALAALATRGVLRRAGTHRGRDVEHRPPGRGQRAHRRAPAATLPSIRWHRPGDGNGDGHADPSSARRLPPTTAARARGSPTSSTSAHGRPSTCARRSEPPSLASTAPPATTRRARGSPARGTSTPSRRPSKRVGHPPHASFIKPAWRPRRSLRPRTTMASNRAHRQSGPRRADWRDKSSHTVAAPFARTRHSGPECWVSIIGSASTRPSAARLASGSSAKGARTVSSGPE